MAKMVNPINQNISNKRNCTLYCFSLSWIAINEFIRLIIYDRKIENINNIYIENCEDYILNTFNENVDKLT
jgi:hypothetical protein